jgi:hypothetical protein
MAIQKDNNEFVWKAKIRAAPVPTVFSPPHSNPETRAKVKPPSVQIASKYTHHPLNNSFP